MTSKDTAQIATKEDLVEFLDLVCRDFKENGKTWENEDLLSFLEAFQAWLGSSQNYYRNMHIDASTVTPWKEVADAFAAARIYE
jgi:hypothetical protein